MEVGKGLPYRKICFQNYIGNNFGQDGTLQPVLIFAVGVECGENRGRTGGEPGGNRGEPGENRGRPKEPGENRGIWEVNRGRTGGFWYSFTKSTGGEAGALGQEPGENRGEGIFFETRDPTQRPENQRTGPPVKISYIHFCFRNSFPEELHFSCIKILFFWN